MNEREYRRLKQQIEDDYKRKIDALELVWKMVDGTSNGLPSTEGPIKRGTIDALVRGVFPYINGVFSPRDVMERIDQLPDRPAGINRSSVSSALKRLADDGLIEVIEIGRGKRASRYRSKPGIRPREAVKSEIAEPTFAEPEEPPLEHIADEPDFEPDSEAGDLEPEPDEEPEPPDDAF